MKKQTPGQQLAKIRWNKATPADRKRQYEAMIAGKKKKPNETL